MQGRVNTVGRPLSYSGGAIFPIRGNRTGFRVQVPPRTPKPVRSPHNRHRLNTRRAAGHHGRPHPAAPPPPVREAAMTAQPVPPVIPGSSRSRRREGKPGASRPMPLASPPGRPGVREGSGRIDASGRVADRATIAALGWRGGDRLTLTAEAGVMIARRDPGGMVTVPSRPHVVIPAALRRRCGLRGRRPRAAGRRLVRPGHAGRVLLCAVVDQALRERTPRAAGDGRQP